MLIFHQNFVLKASKSKIVLQVDLDILGDVDGDGVLDLPHNC
mgnify:CR=1 FL=1